MASEKTPRPRAALDLSLPDIPAAAPPRADPRVLREVAEASGFTSREAGGARKVKKHRRPRTGRDYPFNTKIKPQTYELLSALAVEATEQEGRIVSMAEIFERALDVYAVQRSGGSA